MVTRLKEEEGGLHGPEWSGPSTPFSVSCPFALGVEVIALALNSRRNQSVWILGCYTRLLSNRAMIRSVCGRVLIYLFGQELLKPLVHLLRPSHHEEKKKDPLPPPPPRLSRSAVLPLKPPPLNASSIGSSSPATVDSIPSIRVQLPPQYHHSP